MNNAVSDRKRKVRHTAIYTTIKSVTKKLKKLWRI